MKNKKQEDITAKAVEKLKKQAQEYLDGWKRTKADFENYKKDEVQRVGQFLKFGTEKVITDILETIDDLERTIQHIPDTVKEAQKEWVSGLEQTAKNMYELLKRYGVERIRTVGEKFDPILHEAMQVQQGQQEGNDTVAEEYQAGYKMHNKVIRPARVKVKKSKQ